MEQKKSPKADLESKKNLFFLLGLVISLGLTLLAFEWTNKPKKAEQFGNIQAQEVEDEFIPLTREQEVKPPPLPPPATVDILNIVDNDVEIEDELEIEDTEADDNTYIDIAPIIAAKEEEEVKEEIFFNIIEEPAEFPGGDKALYKFIYDHINYPTIAEENGIQGKVIIKFVVDEQGSATNAEVIRPVDVNLDKEALRVIKMLPKFKPGKHRGKAVKVYYVSTITFRLE
jgi:protein TonB